MDRDPGQRLGSLGLAMARLASQFESTGGISRQSAAHAWKTLRRLLRGEHAAELFSGRMSEKKRVSFGDKVEGYIGLFESGGYPSDILPVGASIEDLGRWPA